MDQIARGCVRLRCADCKRAYRRQRDNARNRSVRAERRRNDEAWRQAEIARCSARARIRRQRVWDKHGGTCYLCDKPCDPDDFHVDHVLAVARGGSDELDNLRVTHPACNMAKSDMLVEEYLARVAA